MEEIIFDDYDECESEKKSEVKVCNVIAMVFVSVH